MAKKVIKTAIKTAIALIIAALLIFMVIYSGRLFLKNAYPIKYSEIIEKYSAEKGLDPYFVYAVVRTESDFSPKARSSAGARGLMQITEETFNWIKGKLGEDEAVFDNMYQPEDAVRYGTFLISYLESKLGCDENILCGYHAGVNRAKEWMANGEYSENGIIDPEKIPYADTRKYVEKVMKTYKIYQKLYK